MSSGPVDLYRQLMTAIRQRFDAVEGIKLLGNENFSNAEMCAFHCRKIVEGTAFGCLVAVEQGLKTIPSDAKGQWNANTIFRRLRSKGLNVFPLPSILREPNEKEKNSLNVKGVIEGQPDRRISVDDLIAIYTRTHKWAHEINPYIEKERSAFMRQHAPALWEDLERLKVFLKEHTVSIANEMIFCTLWDKVDGQTKTLPMTRQAAIA